MTHVQPLRDTHQELLPHIGRLGTVADALGYVPVDEVQVALDEVSLFLNRRLIPYLRAEDQALYPAIDQLAGSFLATEAMRRDQTEALRLIEELGTLRRRLS